MVNVEPGAEVEVLARITTEPKAAVMSGGRRTRRFHIATEVGAASTPVCFEVWVQQDLDVDPSEDLALRAENLREGSLVLVKGVERHRPHRGGGVVPMILASDIRLKSLPASATVAS